jgi:deoxyhypusine synthase
MVWGRLASGKNISIDVFDDMKEIIDIAWSSKKNGVIYLGGGVPKNFIQQSLQFSKGADYGVQITTDRPEPGGSSGAPLEEGISWGKMKQNAKKEEDYIDIFCDATIALPLLLASVKN